MTLSLCMIVKNESAVLERALLNANVYADEIIVVDTGSTDGTAALAKKFTDKVYDFSWCDDFAAARNFAFEKATCDYRMWLDADDVVPMPTARAIARLMKTLDPDTDVVMLPYVLETASDDKPGYVYYRERILRNRPDYLWRGRVHEAVPLHGKIVRKDPAIYHAKPKDRKSGTRNLDIYKKMVNERVKFEPRECYYYARELYFNGEFETAAREFEAFLSMPNGFVVNKIDACLMLARCKVKLGDRDAAYLTLYQSFTYGLPTGEIACELGLMYYADAKYALAAYWFERAAAAKPDPLSGAFVDSDCYGFLPFVWLTVCYDKLGKTRIAFYYHCRARKLKPDHPSVIANQKYFESLGY